MDYIYIARQVPLPMGFFQARILKWVAISFSRGGGFPGGSGSKEAACNAGDPG